MQAGSNDEGLTERWDTEQPHPSDSSGKAQHSVSSSPRSKSGMEAAATRSRASADAGEQSDTIDQADVEASGNTGRDQESYEGSGQLDRMPSRDRYRLIDTVFLRAEAIPEHEMKAITVCQWVGQMVALGLLLVEVALKFTWSDKRYITSKVNQIWNFVAAIGCLIALLTCLGIMFRRIIRYRKKYWGRRRRVIVTLTSVEGCLAVVNATVWAIPNLYVIIKDCEWFSTTINVCAFIKWMSWNSLFMVFLIEARNINFWKRNGKVLRKHGKDRLIMDAPWWNHAWILLNWVAFEGVTIALLVVNTTAYKSRFSTATSRCDSFDYSCEQVPAGTGLLATLFASWILWILLWAYFILKALHDLHLRPWYRYKLANTAIRVQMRARLYGMTMFALSVVLLVFVKIYSCSSYVQTYMGLGPLTIMETVMILSSIYFYMPKTPELMQPMLQVLLQEFSWTEDQKQERLQTRNRQLAELEQDAWLEPMFTFETAIKTFYFSALIYEYQEEGVAAAARKRNPTKATVGGFKLETAMNLYNLERFELLVEPAEDTKVLVCWNRDSVILTFRGTASMTNVLADLQAWQSPHPPDSDGVWSRPKVHAGFLRSWQANGLDRRVIARLKAIFESPGIDMENMRVVMTGHSLGGALATLAAYDIAREFSSLLGKDQVICYTFGSPRTGNHRFAKEYNMTVPDTWHVINARDIVPRSGKFFRLYKRPGQRVIINKMGDMIIRPSFVEISVAQSLPFQSRVTEHFLASYQASFIAVCSAQFGDKAFVDGMEGMRSLISSVEVHEALSYETLDLKRMERLADWGGLTFFQLTGQLQRGVDRLHAQAVGPEPAKKQDKAGRLRCHDGVCWREYDDVVGDLEEGTTLVQRTADPSQRSLASSTLSKRRLSGHLGKPSAQAGASKHSSFASFEALATPGSEPVAEPGRERASGNVATENSHITGTAAEVAHQQQGHREALAAGTRPAPSGEDDAGSLTAAAPQGDRGDVDIGQPSVRGTMHSMSNGPLSHGMPPGVGAGPPQEAPSSTPKHAHWHLPRPCLRLPFFGGQPAIKDATPRPASPLGTAQDLLFKGGTEQQQQPLHASRAVAPRPAPDSVEAPHSLMETHVSMVLQSSRNDRHRGAPSTSRDPQIAAAVAESHTADSLAARRPPNAPESTRSLESSSISSWKSATLDDQLQRMEERGLFSEVLQDALQGREQEREAHHGILHRSLHRSSLQSEPNESRNAVSMDEAQRRVLKTLRRSSAGGAVSDRRSILSYAFPLQ